jgi:hypothetical protein
MKAVRTCIAMFVCGAMLWVTLPQGIRREAGPEGQAKCSAIFAQQLDPFWVHAQGVSVKVAGSRRLSP